MTIRTRRHQEIRSIATRRSTLNKGEIVSKVGKPCALIGANRAGKVTCPMQNMFKITINSFFKSYCSSAAAPALPTCHKWPLLILINIISFIYKVKESEWLIPQKKFFFFFSQGRTRNSYLFVTEETIDQVPLLFILLSYFSLIIVFKFTKIFKRWNNYGKFNL